MTIRRFILAALLAAMTFSFYGCEKPEQTARDAIAAARGVIQTLQVQYKEACVADAGMPVCRKINQAVAAHSTAINALNQYCSGPGYQEGGVCNPRPDLQPHLDAALADLDLIITDLKALTNK